MGRVGGLRRGAAVAYEREYIPSTRKCPSMAGVEPARPAVRGDARDAVAVAFARGDCGGGVGYRSE